jgi:hypothetical protein
MNGSALLNSSNGEHSLTLTRVDDLLYVVLHWVPQGWDIDDPPASEVTLYRRGLPETLLQLSDDLAAHLHRPLHDLAGEPFVGSYEIGTPHARITLTSTETTEDLVSTKSNGAGVLSVTWRSNRSSLDVVMPVDITTLDRFARELADLVY